MVFLLYLCLHPANHHDSRHLNSLVALAQAMGIEMQHMTAGGAYPDNDGFLLAETGVHLLTPVSSNTSLSVNVFPDTPEPDG